MYTTDPIRNPQLRALLRMRASRDAALHRRARDARRAGARAPGGAHNGLGQHERARAICLQALAGVDPEEREYVVMNLGVEIELALAEAGLGRHALAREQLQRLIEEHAPEGSAVTLGALHEARARVALMERDFPAAREHLRVAHSLYQPLGAATLIGRARARPGSSTPNAPLT